MKHAFAQWLIKRLIEGTTERPRPPGGSEITRNIDVDGSEFTLVSNGDTFDIYYGRSIINGFSIEESLGRKVAKWILWDWWVKATWCGMKLRLWRWALENKEPPKKPDELAKEKVKNFIEAKDHRR